MSWTQQPEFCLPKLAAALLEDSPAPIARLLSDPPDRWNGYFQSPFSKAASTLDGEDQDRPSFALDSDGALRDESQITVSLRRLVQWLELGDETGVAEMASAWLHGKAAPTASLAGEIACRLEAVRLRTQQLHNLPICRLVQMNQLRYDPHYQAVYQLTPAQMRLLESEWLPWEAPDPARALAEVQRSQRIFWALTDEFQSAIAMFDSDLGRCWGSKQERDRFLAGLPTEDVTRFQATKEFLRLRFDQKRTTNPHDLNRFSPLRFWAPPPAFVRCVFHLLFWQPILTGYDLYHRPFPHADASAWHPGFPGFIRERIAHFRVAINRFEAASYRITDYGKILRLMVQVAAEIEASKGRKDGLAGLRWEEGQHRARGFLTDHQGLEQALRPITRAKVHIELPLFRKDPAATLFELAWPYHDLAQTGEDKTAEALLAMLRDRTLQLILWAHYQMEIRSVGSIPIHRLYRVEVKEPLLSETIALARRWRAESEKRLRFQDLDAELTEWLRSPKRLEQIVLVKEYDRSDGTSSTDSSLRWLERAAEPRGPET